MRSIALLLLLLPLLGALSFLFLFLAVHAEELAQRSVGRHVHVLKDDCAYSLDLLDAQLLKPRASALAEGSFRKA